MFNLKLSSKGKYHASFSIYSCVNTMIAQAYVASVFDLLTWHNHLAHASLPNVKKVLSCYNVTFSDNKVVQIHCGACSLGKSHKLHFHTSQSSVTKLLHVIDVWVSPMVS